jgi:hypothetical protein
LSAAEQVEAARHEFSVLRREESAHAAVKLPAPLRELLMHDAAQLGYDPPGGPCASAGPAAARSVVMCVPRMADV